MSRAAALVNILNLSLRRDGKPPLFSGDYPFYTAYRYRGGRVALGAVEPKFWERFCRAIEREDLIPRQLDPAAREEVEKFLAEVDCNVLEELAKREEIPLTSVYDIDKALTFSHLKIYSDIFKLQDRNLDPQNGHLEESNVAGFMESRGFAGLEEFIN